MSISKKIILCVFLLLFIMSVSAQSVDDKCYSECKRNCIDSKRSADECYKVCTDKCTSQQELPRIQVLTARPAVEPRPQITCDTWEKLYQECLRMGDSRACADKFSVWKAQCARPSPSCEENCRTLASQLSLAAATANVFNQQLFDQCMRDRCGQPSTCEEKCRADSGDDKAQLANCLSTRCGLSKPTCEEVCKRDFGGDESASADCMRTRCLVSEPTCEDRCRSYNNECEAGRLVSVDPKTQENMPCPVVLKGCLGACGSPHLCEDQCVQESKGDDGAAKRCILSRCTHPADCNENCVRTYAGNDEKIAACVQRECDQSRPDCKERCRPGYETCVNSCERPACPQGGCEVRCLKAYGSCSKNADPSALVRCRSVLGDCVDNCRPSANGITAVPPPPSEVAQLGCDQRCEGIGNGCRAQGLAAEECARRVFECTDRCHPIRAIDTHPTAEVTVNCDTWYGEAYNRCAEAGGTPTSCSEQVRASMPLQCCTETYRLVYDDCISRGTPVDVCAEQTRASLPQHCPEQRAQNESENVGFFARVWAKVFG